MTLLTQLAEHFGSKANLARALGVHPAQVTRWDDKRTRKTQGSGIPYWHLPKLVEECRKRGIDITIDDLINGAPRD